MGTPANDGIGAANNSIAVADRVALAASAATAAGVLLAPAGDVAAALLVLAGVVAAVGWGVAAIGAARRPPRLLDLAVIRVALAIAATVAAGARLAPIGDAAGAVLALAALAVVAAWALASVFRAEAAGATDAAAARFLILPDTSAENLYASGKTEPLDVPRGDSGVDIPVPADVVVPAGGTVWIRLGVRAVCLRGARRTAFWLVPRSSISKTPLLMANSIGLIDVGYRGELIVAVRNGSGADYRVERGRALCQLAAADLAPAVAVVLGDGDPRAAEFFDATARGAGAFGSTGAAGAAGPPV